VKPPPDQNPATSGRGTETTEGTFKLQVEPFVGTPEQVERQWFEKVYKGRGDSMLQLTWRAVIMGSLLGAVLSLTNLYIGLKAGWGFGVAITACILSYAIWESLYRAGLGRTRMTILENNCMQSTASAAGYSTGSTLVSAFSAYIMLNGHQLPLGLTLAWVFFVAVLGVTMAVPMKRQMINVEQLPFPSGIAAAETLQALYSQGAKAMRAAKALGLAAIVAALDKFWADGFGVLSRKFSALKSLEDASSVTLLSNLSSRVLGKEWIGRTVEFSWDAVFVAAGAITGLRVCVSMLISGTFCWMIFVPILQQEGIITGSGFRTCVQWTLWAGTSCMVTSGLFTFFLQWRTALSAFRGLGSIFSRKSQQQISEMEAIETPGSWVVTGQVVSLIALAWLAYYSFAMPVWQSVVAVLLSFALAVVACRVTGETDTTPQGAMGKVTQLIFGALNPGNMNVNLMSANITGGTAVSAADLLTDLKSGYLLGANPRKQFLAQFAGIFTGTLVTCLTFTVLIPNAQTLGSKQFPAPAAQTWSAVAQALGKGLSGLEPLKVWLIIIGGVLGIILAILPMLFPKHAKYFPSAAAVGLAWIFQWYYGVLFFLGALIAWFWQKQSPKSAEEFTYSVASGVIAGGSLMGVFLIFWENGPEILMKLLRGS
jgi:OPT family oligopeptide transporter